MPQVSVRSNKDPRYQQQIKVAQDEQQRANQEALQMARNFTGYLIGEPAGLSGPIQSTELGLSNKILINKIIIEVENLRERIISDDLKEIAASNYKFGEVEYPSDSFVKILLFFNSAMQLHKQPNLTNTEKIVLENEFIKLIPHFKKLSTDLEESSKLYIYQVDKSRPQAYRYTSRLEKLEGKLEKLEDKMNTKNPESSDAKTKKKLEEEIKEISEKIDLGKEKSVNMKNTVGVTLKNLLSCYAAVELMLSKLVNRTYTPVTFEEVETYAGKIIKDSFASLSQIAHFESSFNPYGLAKRKIPRSEREILDLSSDDSSDDDSSDDDGFKPTFSEASTQTLKGFENPAQANEIAMGVAQNAVAEEQRELAPAVPEDVEPLSENEEDQDEEALEVDVPSRGSEIGKQALMKQTYSSYKRQFDSTSATLVKFLSQHSGKINRLKDDDKNPSNIKKREELMNRIEEIYKNFDSKSNNPPAEITNSYLDELQALLTSFNRTIHEYQTTILEQAAKLNFQPPKRLKGGNLEEPAEVAQERVDNALDQQRDEEFASGVLAPSNIGPKDPPVANPNRNPNVVNLGISTAERKRYGGNLFMRSRPDPVFYDPRFDDQMLP